jgi:hypothetical protein
MRGLGWNEISIRVLEMIYSYKYRAWTTRKGIVKMLVCLPTEYFHVSLKILWKKHTLKISPFPAESSYRPKKSHNFCPAASAQTSLHSVSEQSLIHASVTRSPLVKFQSLMVLSRFRLKFLSFMKKVSIPNLAKILRNGLLIMEVKEEFGDQFFFYNNRLIKKSRNKYSDLHSLFVKITQSTSAHVSFELDFYSFLCL